MIYLGADHNGFWLKQELKEYLHKHKVVCKDLGAFSHKKNDDYPDYAVKISRAIKNGDLGILICGTGHGMTIVANKVKGIRAALALSVFSAKHARAEEDTNIMVLSAWETTVEKAKRIVAAWLSTQPSKARRHIRRINKIKRLET